MAAGSYDAGSTRPVDAILTDVEQLLDELAGAVGPGTDSDGPGTRDLESTTRIMPALMWSPRWTRRGRACPASSRANMSWASFERL
jgi:hypothetical protein